MQELPNVYKLVCLYCLPLRGRHAEVVVPYDLPMKLFYKALDLTAYYRR